MNIRDLITKLNNVLVINKLDPKDEATIGEAIVELDDLDKQIDRVARWIMTEVPGEPSTNEGAIDCALRIMGRRAFQEVRPRYQVWFDQNGGLTLGYFYVDAYNIAIEKDNRRAFVADGVRVEIEERIIKIVDIDIFKG